MSMDPQLFNMINQRFDAVEDKLDHMAKMSTEHAAQDLKYWRMIDVHNTEMGMLKRLFWGVISLIGVLGTALGAWFEAKH